MVPKKNPRASCLLLMLEEWGNASHQDFQFFHISFIYLTCMSNYSKYHHSLWTGSFWVYFAPPNMTPIDESWYKQLIKVVRPKGLCICKCFDKWNQIIKFKGFPLLVTYVTWIWIGWWKVSGKFPIYHVSNLACPLFELKFYSWSYVSPFHLLPRE